MQMDNPWPRKVKFGSKSHTRTMALYFACVAIFVIAVVYLLQLTSPLRLNTDAMGYLSLTASALDGRGFLDRGEPSHFPPGYPTLLGLLYLLGLPVPPALIAANLAFVAIAANLTFIIARKEFDFPPLLSIACAGGLLLSFVLIKHVTLPVAESVFLGTSMAALYALVQIERARGWPQVLWIGAALLLIVGATLIRTIGVALVPVLIFVVGRLLWLRFPSRRSRNQKLAGIGILTLVVGGPFVFAVVRSIYFDDLVRIVFGYGVPGRIIGQNANWKLLEWGQLFINVPLSQLPDLFTTPALLIGLLGLGLVGYGIFLRRARFGPPEVYLLCYAGILFLWPGFDTRFWLPALPLIVLFSITSFRRLFEIRPLRPLIGAYAFSFIAAGFLALAYSTSVSLAGSEFPHRFGDGSLTSTYLLVYEGEAGEGEINNRALRLLRRFEPNIHHAALLRQDE
jgi:hypothetical protein